jgi:hypothetical protein
MPRQVCGANLSHLLPMAPPVLIQFNPDFPGCGSRWLIFIPAGGLFCLNLPPTRDYDARR